MGREEQVFQFNPKAIEEFLKECDRSLREMIANFLTEEVQKNISALKEIFIKSIKSLSKIDWEGSTKFWIVFAENLASKGWTFPGLLDKEEVAYLLEANTKEVDQFFLDFYDIEENYKSLKKDLLDHELLDEWQTLLIQCVENFEKGNYIIVIPSLFTILEGIAHKLIFPKYRAYQKPNVRKSLPKQFDIVRGELKEEGLCVEIIFYASVQVFLAHVFRAGAFDQDKVERPLLINRNWVLHGRDNPTDWQKVDALRLFNAISTLTLLDFLLEDKIEETVAR